MLRTDRDFHSPLFPVCPLDLRRRPAFRERQIPSVRRKGCQKNTCTLTLNVKVSSVRPVLSSTTSRSSPCGGLDNVSRYASACAFVNPAFMTAGERLRCVGRPLGAKEFLRIRGRAGQINEGSVSRRQSAARPYELVTHSRCGRIPWYQTPCGPPLPRDAFCAREP